MFGKRFSLDCTYMVFTLCSSLLGHFSMWVLIASRRSTAEDESSLLTAGCLVETGRNLYTVTVILFLCGFPSLKSPFSLSSYHAVQGWMEELRVDVGKAGELALVDVGNDQLVRRGENGLGTREKLVKVFCSFAALKEIKKKGMSDAEKGQLSFWSPGSKKLVNSNRIGVAWWKALPRFR